MIGTRHGNYYVLMYGYKFVEEKSLQKDLAFYHILFVLDQLWKVCVSRLSNTKAKRKIQRNLDICSMVMKVVTLK